MSLNTEAHAYRPFPQLSLMSERGFASFLESRNLGIGTKGIQALVDYGVIKRIGNSPVCFHPFHIWPVQGALQQMLINLAPVIRNYSFDAAAIHEFIDLAKEAWDQRLQELEKVAGDSLFNRKMLDLLLQVEQYYIPIIRRRLRNVDPATWHEWREQTEPKKWLHEYSLSLESIVAWRRGVLMSALDHDPAPNHYLLFRSMPFEKREKFRGPLLLAYDLYEIAEILRLFLQDVSGGAVTKEWDPTGDVDASWVERLYGTQPRFGEKEFLRPLARNYGLDPTIRVLWLVEGATEEAFIRRYAERLGVDINHYIRLDNAGGDGALISSTKWMTPRLNAAMKDQCFVTITFDESEDSRRQARILTDRKQINLPYALCRPDFERDNFTTAQLVKVACVWVSESTIVPNIDEVTAIVTKRFQEEKEDFKRAFNSALRELKIPSSIHKGEEWGCRLADYLSNHREQQYLDRVYSEERLSKIEEQILTILQDSQPYIDYPLSIEKLNTMNLEIPHRNRESG